MATAESYIGLEVRGYLYEEDGPRPVRGTITEFLDTNGDFYLYRVDLGNETVIIAAMIYQGELSAPGEFPHMVIEDQPLDTIPDPLFKESFGSLDVQGVERGYETVHSHAGIPVDDHEEQVMFDEKTRERIEPERWNTLMEKVIANDETIEAEDLPLDLEMTLLYRKFHVVEDGVERTWCLLPGWYVPDPNGEGFIPQPRDVTDLTND